MSRKNMLFGSVVLAACFVTFIDVESYAPPQERLTHSLLARRLAGTWELDPQLTKELIGKDRPSSFGAVVTFTLEKNPAGKFSQSALKQLDDLGMSIDGGGIVSFHNRTRPFVVSSYQGNSAVIYAREPDGLELRYSLLVPSQDVANDLLFIAGDTMFGQDDQLRAHFAAYRRKSADESE